MTDHDAIYAERLELVGASPVCRVPSFKNKCMIADDTRRGFPPWSGAIPLPF